MSHLVDEKMLKRIERTGTALDLGDRAEMIKKFGLPADREAENVVISGCLTMFMATRVLRSLVNIFDRAGLSYTFLSTEYCCGNYLYRPAIKARDDSAMDICREYSRDFIGRNLGRARELGAKRIIVFCSPCYPIYKLLYPGENIVFYPEAIYGAMKDIESDTSIDYYPGCYKLHRRISPVPMDLESTDRVFGRIKGLNVNRIEAAGCCFSTEGLHHMINAGVTKRQIHICTGCYDRAEKNMPGEKGVEVMMLPEFIEKLTTGPGP